MFPGLPRVADTRPSVPPDDWEPAPARSRGRWLRALAAASRACCCPARPAVVVLIPAAPGRPHRTDLLLCRHHYRVSRGALARAKAVVLDPDGVPSAESPTSDDATRQPLRLRSHG